MSIVLDIMLIDEGFKFNQMIVTIECSQNHAASAQFTLLGNEKLMKVSHNLSRDQNTVLQHAL